MTTILMPKKARREWLDRSVTKALHPENWETVAAIRAEVDRSADQHYAAQLYEYMPLRRRTQAVRRSLQRLTRQHLAEAHRGPGHGLRMAAKFRGVIGPMVEHKPDNRTNVHLQLAQNRLQHAALLRQLRRLFAALCDHDQHTAGCSACTGFRLAGGSFTTKAGDADTLGSALKGDN